jgi:dolichol-phosphate mannosyltransferase
MSETVRQKVTVVVPTRNEEQTVAEVLTKAGPHADELLVIDGHSTDRTAEIATELGARVVQDQGRGKGAAMRQGLGEATGEIVVFVDADGSHDPDDIPAMIAPIVADEAEMVIGSRFKGGSDELVGTFNQLFRITGSNIITTFINYKFGVHLSDTQNGFRAIKREVGLTLDLREDGFPIETEMDMALLAQGGRIAEIPSHEYRRAGGQSKIVLLRIWWQYPLLLLRYLFKPVPNRGPGPRD